MELNTVNPRSKRRSAAEIRLLLDEQKKSGFTVKEFCATQGINEGTFFNWRKKYDADRLSVGDFISLQINKPDATASLFAEIELPGKATIRLFSKVEPSWFKELF